MPRRFVFVWSVLALVLSIHVSGCSVIGYLVGNELDKGRTVKLRPGEPVQVVRLDPGATVALQMADGSRIVGRYLGIEARPDPAYVERYAAWCDSAAPGFRPPRIGEPILIRAREKSFSSRDYRGAFAGFGPRAIHVVSRRGKAESVRMDETRELTDSTGTDIDQEHLLAAADRVPVQVIVRLRLRKNATGDSLGTPARANNERGVDLLDGSVVGIELGGPSKVYRYTFFAIGFVADALILAALSFDSASSSSGSGCSYSGGSYAVGVTPMRVAPDTLWMLPQARALLAAAE
jgi:hypothetical protein